MSKLCAAQLEEEIQEDLKWSILVKKKLFSGKSDFQTVELIESGPFAKVRFITRHCLVPLLQARMLLPCHKLASNSNQA